jgi:hypothetical protein
MAFDQSGGNPLLPTEDFMAIAEDMVKPNRKVDLSRFEREVENRRLR